MKARRPWIIVGAGVAALTAGSAAAHDFFLRPAAFTAAPGSVVAVDATVSSSFPDLLNPVTADRLQGVRVAGGGRRAAFEVAGVGSKSLKLRFHGHEPGWAVLSTRTLPRDVEYPEDRIGGIMEEYEVSPEAARAVANLQKPRVLKVVSTRFAKSFICVQRCSNAGEAEKPVGHDVEFVARAGAAHTFRLLDGGRPLADYPVAVVGSDGVRRRLRTGQDGAVVLPAEARGPTMLFASVMRPPASKDARFTLKLASLTVAGR